ncbi:hypothetical protein D3C78_1895460 [compost metagenome]
MLLLSGNRRFDRQQLRINIRPVQCGKLWRQRSDIGRRNARSIDQARHLDAGFLRQVGNQACVHDVAPNFVRTVRLHRLQNI